MGLTVVQNKRFKFGNGFGIVAIVTFDDSYPTGGESLSAGQLGLNNISFVLPASASGYLFEYDEVNSKLKAMCPRAAIEDSLAASVDTGETAVTSSAANGEIITLSGAAGVAAGAGEEVANETDLHDVSVKLIAIGI